MNAPGRPWRGPSLRALASTIVALGLLLAPAASMGNQGSPGRLVAVIDSFPAGAFIKVALSADGQTLFTAVSVQRHAVLLARDISDPQRPRELSRTSFGPDWPHTLKLAGARLYLLAYAPGAVSDLLVYDVADPARPRKLAHLRNVGLETLEVSADGLSVWGSKATVSEADSAAATERAGFDLRDPSQPKLLKGEGPAPPPAIRDLEAPSTSFFEVLDSRGGLTLSTADRRLSVWSVVPGMPPHRLTRISVGDFVEEGQLLPGGKRAVLVVDTKSGTTALGVYDISYKPPTAARLERADVIARAHAADGALGAGVAAAILEDAGAQTLADANPPGLARARRVAILRHYGRFLAQAGDPAAALTIVRAVTRLSPADPDVWLELGQVAELTIAASDGEQEKVDSWREAKMAYQRHTALAGHVTTAGRGLAAFDLPRELRASSDACLYVASAWTAGAGDWIEAKEGQLRVDGQAHRLTVETQGLGCAYPEAKVDGADVDEDTVPSDDALVQRRLQIVPFHQRSYLVVLDGVGPYAVWEPGVGKVCDLRRSFHPVLVVNRSPLCRRLAAGSLKPNVRWRRTAADAMVDTEVTRWPAIPTSLDAYADVDLAPRTKYRIGHFADARSDSCGHAAGGVVLMRGLKAASGPAARSLARAQSAWWSPAESDGDLYRSGDRTYVLLQGGKADDQPRSPSALLTLTSSKFVPICRVEQRVSYASARSPH